MNTPGHIVLNTLLLGRGRFREHWPAIMAGATVPDLPTVFFYAYQSMVLRSPERFIWNEAYFQSGWQAVFDTFHSLPLIALLALLAWRARSEVGLAFLCSMALHSIADLPLHHDDGHAHFFPFSSWRFQSPVSYWDPQHHGEIVLFAEAVLIVAGCISFTRSKHPRGLRIASAGLLAAAVSYATYALVVWGGAAVTG